MDHKIIIPMKINLLNLSILTSLCLLFASCSESVSESTSKTFWIDNPLDKEIKIKIDDKEIKIPAQSGVEQSIEYGSHELSYDGQKAKFMAKPSAFQVIMNPTLSNYVMYAEVYYYEDSQKAIDQGNVLLDEYSQDYKLANDSVRRIPIRVYSSLFFDASKEQWDYDITTPIPDQIETQVVKDTKLLAGLKKKLFREKDFFAYIGAEINLSRPETTKLDDLKLEPVISEELLTSDCPEAQKGLDSLKASIIKLETSTSNHEFMEAYKPFENMYNEETGVARFVNKVNINKDCPTRSFVDTRREINNRLTDFNNISAWIVK